MHSFCMFRKQIKFYPYGVTIDLVLWGLVFICSLVDRECHYALLLSVVETSAWVISS